jgi:hypothetical protein
MKETLSGKRKAAIIELARRGVGGEKENAQQILRKHGVPFEGLSLYAAPNREESYDSDLTFLDAIAIRMIAHTAANMLFSIKDMDFHQNRETRINIALDDAKEYLRQRRQQ